MFRYEYVCATTWTNADTQHPPIHRGAQSLKQTAIPVCCCDNNHKCHIYAVKKRVIL